MKEIRVGQIEGIIYRHNDGKIEYLLLRRNAQKGGFWQPVTGGIRQGEMPKEALSRELQEELNLSNDEYEISGFAHSFQFTLESGQKITEHVFGINLTGKKELSLSWEHTEYRWVDLKEAINLFKWDSNKEAIEKLDIYLHESR